MCEACSPGGVLLARTGLGRLSGRSFVLAPDEPQAAPPPPSGDVVLYGGPIITMAGGSFTPVDAVALRGGTVLAVGPEQLVRAAADPSAELIDLQGRCVVPGFVEPHLHLVLSGYANAILLDVSPPTVNHDRATALALIQQAAATTTNGWVQAFGYDPSRMNDYADLDADLLDGASETVGIFVLNQSGHLAYVNHKAFALAGITDSTPNPEGGTYVHDAAGHLTGVVLEQPAITTFTTVMPTPAPAEIVAACSTVLDDWAAAGCTTVYDAGIGSIAGVQDLSINNAAIAKASTPPRMSAAMLPEAATALKATPGQLVGAVTLSGIKYWADGSTQGFTAALREPYLGDQGTGVLNWTQDDLTAQVREWHDKGWQIVIHSNGDAASDQTLNAYEAVLGPSPGPQPHRIEHFTVTDPDQIVRAAGLGLNVSHTIGHVRYWGHTFLDHVLGSPRAERIDPLADDLANSLPFSLHSDSPVTTVGPLGYLRTAVTRLMDLPDGSESVLGPEQRVDLETALRAVTLTAARHALLEDEVGSLEIGKAADLVVLDQDPRRVAPEQLDRLKVEETWLGGRRQVWPATAPTAA